MAKTLHFNKYARSFDVWIQQMFLRCVSTLLKGGDFTYTSNELRVDGWDEDNAKSIPIQPFFYFPGTLNGMETLLSIGKSFFINLVVKIYPSYRIAIVF